MKGVSIKDNSGNPCQDDHQDRIDLELPGEDECASEDQEAFIVDEVLAVHQQQGGGGNQADCSRTKAVERGCYIFVVPEFGKGV